MSFTTASVSIEQRVRELESRVAQTERKLSAIREDQLQRAHADYERAKTSGDMWMGAFRLAVIAVWVFVVLMLVSDALTR